MKTITPTHLLRRTVLGLATIAALGVTKTSKPSRAR